MLLSDSANAPAVQVGPQLMLEPTSITDKRFQWKRRRRFRSRCFLVRLQAIRRLRIGDTGRLARGTKEHSCRHLLCPEIHRLAENPHGKPFGPEIKYRRKSVRGCTD